MKRIACLTAAAGGLVLLACTDHITSPSATSERRGTSTASNSGIAFVSTRGARWSWPDIYLANGDGTGVRRLTLGTAPAWSPDGRRIAFHRDDNPYDRRGIYVINADGSGERFLGVGWSPSWASDGRIAFSLPGGASNGSIAVMVPDYLGFQGHLIRGSSLVTDESCEDGWLTPTVDRPAWSPDSRQIAFVLTCSHMWSRLFVMNDDGSEPRLLVDSWQAYSAAWSPDGSRLAATIDGAISVMDVQSGTWKTYEDVRTTGKLDWSPDGRQIVFAAGDPGEERVFVLSLETGDVRQFIASTLPDYYADVEPAWSRMVP